ncbi:MAG: PIN domain-containing protein [Schlesneria sp.]
MALICDTSGVFALYDIDDTHHQSTVDVVQSESGPLLLPVILLAEIDYLLHQRLGREAAFEFIEAVELGQFTLVPLTAPDVTRCRELVAQYRDLEIGLADASVAAAAERLNVPRLLSLDHRHFRAIAPRNFNHFVMLPSDAMPRGL